MLRRFGNGEQIKMCFSKNAIDQHGEVEGCLLQDERPHFRYFADSPTEVPRARQAPGTMRSKVIAPREVQVWTGTFPRHDHQQCFAAESSPPRCGAEFKEFDLVIIESKRITSCIMSAQNESVARKYLPSSLVAITARRRIAWTAST